MDVFLGVKPAKLANIVPDSFGWGVGGFLLGKLFNTISFGFFRVCLKIAFAFLKCMMFSVIISLLSLFHFFFFSSLSVCISLFHQGTLWGGSLGVFWGLFCVRWKLLLCVLVYVRACWYL